MHKCYICNTEFEPSKDLFVCDECLTLTYQQDGTKTMQGAKNLISKSSDALDVYDPFEFDK